MFDDNGFFNTLPKWFFLSLISVSVICGIERVVMARYSNNDVDEENNDVDEEHNENNDVDEKND